MKQETYESKEERDRRYWELRRKGIYCRRHVIRNQFLWDGGVENIGLPMTQRKNFRVRNVYVLNIFG